MDHPRCNPLTTLLSILLDGSCADAEACQALAGAGPGLEWDGTRTWTDRAYGCLLTVADGGVNWNNKAGGKMGSNIGQRVLHCAGAIVPT